MCRTTRRVSMGAGTRFATAASTSGAARGMCGARHAVKPSPSYGHPSVLQSQCSHRRVQYHHRPRRLPRCLSSERGRIWSSTGCDRSTSRASSMARSHARIPLLGVGECRSVREHAQRSRHRCRHRLFRRRLFRRHLPRHQSASQACRTTPLPQLRSIPRAMRNLAAPPAHGCCHPSSHPFLPLHNRSSLMLWPARFHRPPTPLPATPVRP